MRNSAQDKVTTSSAPPRVKPSQGRLLILFGSLFIFIQVTLSAANAMTLSRYLQVDPSSGYSLGSTRLALRLPLAAALAATTYILVAAPGVTAARMHGHAWLAPLALIGYVLLSGPGLAPIGLEWRLSCDMCPWFGAPWLGPSVDIILLSAPAVLISRERGDAWGSTTTSAIAAIAVGALMLLTVWAIGAFGQSIILGPAVVAGVMGAWIGIPRFRWAVAVLTSILWLTGAVREAGSLLLANPQYGFPVGWDTVSHEAFPLIAIAAIGGFRHVMTRGLEALSASPITLLAIVNGLNVLDTLATWASVSSGRALEANPAIRLVGLPAKIALVLLASWIIFRKRPSWLLVPAVVLGLVATYHVVGLVLAR